RVMLGRERRGVGQLHRDGVTVHAVETEFVVKMRAAREAGHADVADELPLPHATTDAESRCESRHMAIQGRDIPAVLDFDRVAVAPLAAAVDDTPVAR